MAVLNAIKYAIIYGNAQGMVAAAIAPGYLARHGIADSYWHLSGKNCRISCAQGGIGCRLGGSSYLDPRLESPPCNLDYSYK